MKKAEKLSKLRAEDVKNLGEDIRNIIKLADVLDNIDNTDYIAEDESHFREDVVKGSFKREDILSNAKIVEDGFIIVPKVVG